MAMTKEEREKELQQLIAIRESLTKILEFINEKISKLRNENVLSALALSLVKVDQISSLNNLLAMIQCEKECLDQSDDAFFDVFSQALAILRLSDSQVAQDLDMSAPTIRRWRSCESAPHPAFRNVVYSYLSRKVKEELKKLEV